jgi:hypothetical protein
LCGRKDRYACSYGSVTQCLKEKSGRREGGGDMKKEKQYKK